MKKSYAKKILSDLYKKLIESEEEADYGDELDQNLADEDFEDSDDAYDRLEGRKFTNDPQAKYFGSNNVRKALNGTDKESEDELEAEVDAGYFSDQDPNIDTDEEYYDTKAYETDPEKFKTGKGHAKPGRFDLWTGSRAKDIDVDSQMPVKPRKHSSSKSVDAANKTTYNIEPSFYNLGDSDWDPDVGQAWEDDYLVDPDMESGDKDLAGNTIKWYD